MPMIVDGGLDGKAIKIGRAMRGWSQHYLGKVTQIQPRRIWQIENNVAEPTPDELGRILQALATTE